MQAGKLRHRVSIERDSGTTQNALGERVQNWTLIGEFYAEVKPPSGRELMAAKQVQSDVTHSVRLRGSPDTARIKSRDRVKFGDRVLEIGGVVNVDERSREIILSCVERVIE